MSKRPPINHANKGAIWTKEEFIKEASRVHNNKYDYSKVQFIDSSTKVCVICPKHGEFYVSPYHHMVGIGCGRCADDKMKEKYQNIRMEKLKELSDKFPNLDFSKSYPTKQNAKMLVTCKKHGDFYTTLSSLLHKSKYGCPKCANEASSLKQRNTKEKFIEESNKVHNYKYNYDKVEYKNLRSKIIITCPIHGDFIQQAGNHISGEGCPFCKGSKGEGRIKEYLEYNNYNFQAQIKFNTKNEYGHDFIADFVVNYNNYKIIIEYNGKQHYQAVSWFGGNEKFQIQTERDEIVRQFVLDHSENYKLLEIPYEYNTSKIDNILDKYFSIPEKFIPIVLFGVLDDEYKGFKVNNYCILNTDMMKELLIPYYEQIGYNNLEALSLINNKFNNPDFVIENEDSNNHSDSLSE